MDKAHTLLVENKMKKIIKAQAIVTLALLGITMPALATEHNRWYFGAGGGLTLANIAQQEIIADLLAAGYETTEFRDNESDFGYKLYVGYQFNPYLALEGGYFDLGTFDYTATTIPAGSKTGSLSFSGWNMDAVGTITLTERSSLIARIGLHEGTTKTQFAGTGAVNVLNSDYRNKDIDYKIGVGYQYKVNDAWSLRLEAERFRIDDAVGNTGHVDLYSLNVVYRFGTRKHAPVAATPPPPVQEPAPRPVAVATEQYCAELGIQFEIGNENIERVNREPILVLATFLAKYPDTTAIIQGHTDNVGTPADNQRLSEQRANSLRNYLIREHGINASRLTAVGFGESQPIASNSTTQGQQANRRINTVIDCATDIAGLSTLPARTTLATALEFDIDSSAVQSKYHSQLESVAKYMQLNPDVVVTLEGHTDNANPANAQRISQERAQSVADYLVQKLNVDRSRLNVEGFGATRRDTYNITASNRQENRRVNIVIGYPH